MERNSKGQLIYGTRNETTAEKERRIGALREAAKKSESYLGDLRFSPLFTIWRAFKFTRKGQIAGNSLEWNNFKTFYYDMSDGYKKGLRLGRLNKELPFCKENCMWMTNSELSFSRVDAITLEYNGENKLLKEWCTIYNVPYNAAKQRVRFGFSPHEILFGRMRKQKKRINDYLAHSRQGKRDKISKMIASYRCRDKKWGLACDLTTQWVIDNIISKPCSYCDTTLNIGCDRINNKIGHTTDNVIPACYECNTIRKDLFSVEEMKLIGAAIKEIKNKRNPVEHSKLKIA